MKYIEKYKRIDDNWANGGMFRGKETCCCVICDEQTEWIEPTWLFNVCSDECYSTLWKTYKETMMQCNCDVNEDIDE